MPLPADTFQKASFNGIPFPILRVSLKGSLRHHVHEFPHSPGGEVEKMGRRLYSCTMTAFFHDVPESILEDEYPELYPQGLFLLQRTAEDEKSGPLVIPNVGTMQAVCIDWRRTFDFPASLSGEAVELEFIEDQDRESVFEKVELGRGALGQKTERLGILLGGVWPFNPPSIFQTINDVVTAIQSLEGLGDAYSRILEAKLYQLVEACAIADRLFELQAPENHLVVKALKDIWLTGTQAIEDLLSRRSPIHTWTVPGLMSVGQASTSIFGSADRAVDLLQLNPIEDAFAIPAGTVLRYYNAE